MCKTYKQIVVLSGKGGTGKTTISSAIASLLSNKVIIDCDVEAANLHLTLKPRVENKYDFYGGKKASIKQGKCIECGICESICNFNAIKNFQVNPYECEGCGFCYRVCPEDAISFELQLTGRYYKCDLHDGSKFYYARLEPGETNSGKLVSELKEKAISNINESVKWVVVDGPPGIGCPVNASLASADYVLIVTEPSKSAMNDSIRLIGLLRILKLRAGIIINKSDLNEEVCKAIEHYAFLENIPIIGRLPFDEQVIQSLREGKSIIDTNELYYLKMKDAIKLLKNEIRDHKNKLVEI